jgi:hypothetical protein
MKDCSRVRPVVTASLPGFRPDAPLSAPGRKEKPRQGFEIGHVAEGKRGSPARLFRRPWQGFSAQKTRLPAKGALSALQPWRFPNRTQTKERVARPLDQKLGKF